MPWQRLRSRWEWGPGKGLASQTEVIPPCRRERELASWGRMVVRKMKRSSSGGTSSTAGMLAHKGGIMQEVAEEGALIAAALIAVSTLYVTR